MTRIGTLSGSHLRLYEFSWVIIEQNIKLCHGRLEWQEVIMLLGWNVIVFWIVIIGQEKEKENIVINGGEQSFPLENMNSLGIWADNTSSSKERVEDSGTQGKITSSEVLWGRTTQASTIWPFIQTLKMWVSLHKGRVHSQSACKFTACFYDYNIVSSRQQHSPHSAPCLHSDTSADSCCTDARFKRITFGFFFFSYTPNNNITREWNKMFPLACVSSSQIFLLTRKATKIK